MTEDPKRLLDEDDIEPELRTALGAAKGLPPEARLAAIGARLPKGPGGGGGGGGWTFGARAGVFGASALVVGVAAYALWPHGSSPSTAVPPVSVAHDEAPVPTRPVAPDPSAATVGVPVEALQTATAAIAAPMPSLPSAKVDPSLEIALLHQAQDALAEHPDVSLARCDEQRRLFPNSSVAQEREVLAIEALVRLGRASDAQRRADAFQKAYPGSAHQRRVDTLLAHP